METWRLALILTAISLSHPRTGALEKLAEPDLTGPSSALAGSVVEFYCELPGKPVNLSVQYELYVESDPGRLIGEYSSLSENPATFFHVITQKHDGRIICKVSGHNNTDIESSFSKGLDFRVIAPNTVPPSVVIVVFSSFALLSAAVISCCVYGVVLRRRYSRKYPERPGKTRPDEEEEEKEDYLEMLEDFEEDVVQADRLSDSGDEERSVDETVQYEGGVSE
ncbi:uncharacterized protein si:dkey-93h22.7 isoform X4 [Puntigrus tetrazona]|uniref:uncharacterized protein si:dkey-93h22.7 isoform X4 n=1 Tax=Puntigrus tetrazona TaxID=1606681 RepID=UPI001C895E53|nr:uncharacterized protein si:dkey-93h22.7 isoform X4 [Puntigrus tetrazona]